MGPEDGEWILDEAVHPAGAGPGGTGEYETDPVAAAEAWLGGDEGQPDGARPAWERGRRDEAWPEDRWPEDG
jgi:hypothetical protein